MKTFAVPAAINGVTFLQYCQWLFANDKRCKPDFSLENFRIVCRVEDIVIRATENATSIVVTNNDYPKFKALVNNPDISACGRGYAGETAADIAARTLFLGGADTPFQTAINGAV